MLERPPQPPAPRTPPELEVPTGRLILHADAPREQWLETRRGGIGGSDAAALLNRSP